MSLIAKLAVEFVTPLSRTTTLVLYNGRYVTETAKLLQFFFFFFFFFSVGHLI